MPELDPDGVAHVRSRYYVDNSNNNHVFLACCGALFPVRRTTAKGAFITCLRCLQVQHALASQPDS